MTVMTAAPHDLVEGLTARIERLVAERQMLRADDGGHDALERNRREICRLQHELSLALVARYQPA